MNARHRTAAASPRRKRRGRMLTFATGLLALAFFVPAHGGETLASWTDSEYGQASLTALSVPKPVIASCVASNVIIVGAKVTFTWSFDHAGATSADVVYSWGSSLLSLLPISLGGGVATTGPVGSVYTTVFQGGLLSNTLGGPAYATVQTIGPGGWVSPVSYVRADMPAIVGNAPCTITNG